MSSTSTDRQDWQFRTTIGFYLISIALTTIGVVNLVEYRNEVKALSDVMGYYDPDDPERCGALVYAVAVGILLAFAIIVIGAVAVLMIAKAFG
ncbi:MAG: hypothetical protein IPK58_22250 [Acidobacteria bacterium]|nr:hypothetical protein [Acidobacteriota bacterium]